MSAILILLIIFALIEMFHASRRGIVRQVVHVVFTAAAFFFALTMVTNAMAEIGSLFTADTIEAFLVELTASGEIQLTQEAIDAIKSINPDILNALFALPISQIFAPILFVLFFLLIYFICQILFFIISRLFPKVGGAFGKIGGMAVGLVEAVLAFSLVMLPVAAINNIGMEFQEKVDLESFVISEADGVEVTAADIITTEENFVFDLSLSLGGGMLESFNKVTIGDVTYDMRAETSVLIDLAATLSDLGTEFDPANLTENDKAIITSSINSIGDSKYLSLIASGVFGLLDGLLENIEIDSENGGELYGAIINDLIAICATSDATTIKGDLTTIKDVLFILSDNGILANFAPDTNADDMVDMLVAKDANGNTVIDQLISTLKANKRTSPLVATLTKLSVSIMAEKMGLDADAAELYDDVKEGINEIVQIDRSEYASDVEYKDAIADTIYSTLADNGIEIEAEAVDAMASYAAENFEGVSELTDEDINDILLKYYDAFVK